MLTLIQVYRVRGFAEVEHYCELEVTVIPRKDESVVIDEHEYEVKKVLHDYDLDDIHIYIEAV